MPRSSKADLFDAQPPPADTGGSVTKRFLRVALMLIVLIGLLALAYYVIHNLPWWGFMILVIIVLTAVLVASSRCQNFVRKLVDDPM